MKEKILYIFIALNIILSIMLFNKIDILKNSIDSLETEQLYTSNEISKINKQNLEIELKIDSLEYSIDKKIDDLEDQIDSNNSIINEIIDKLTY